MSSARHESTVARAWYRHPIWPVLLVIACIAWMFALRHWSLTIWQRGIDEDQYREYGLAAMNHLPGSLWSLTDYHRGLQRLAPWNLGLSLKLFGTPDGFVVARTVVCAMWTLTAVPTWRWARSAGAAPASAALVALLAVVVPWAVLTTTFLTEAFAYPLATLALYAIWRAAVHPNPRSIGSVVVAIVVAALARSVMILLVPIAVIVIVAAWQRFHPRRSWRRGLITFGAFFAVMFLAAAGLNHLMFVDRSLAGALVGQYEPGLRVDCGAALHVLVADAARIVSGVGILPAVLGAAFVGRTLLRPVDRGEFALGLLLPLILLFVVYSTMRAGVDERYVIYLAPSVFVAAAVAVSRRALRPAGLLIATVGAIVLMLDYGWARGGGYEFFTEPASTFHRRILIDGLAARQPLPPGLLLALAVSAGAALTWWIVQRGPGWKVVAVATGAAVLGFQAAQSVYAVGKHLSTNRYAPASVSALSWVDRALPKHEQAVLLATGNRPDWDPVWSTWRDIEFWNLSTGTGISLPNAGVSGVDSPPVTFVGEAVVDPATGRLVFAGARAPRYVLQVMTPAELGLVGRPVGDSWLPIQLLRLDAPARVIWWLRGVGQGGWLTDGTTAAVLTFPRNAPQPSTDLCLTATVAAAMNLPHGRLRVRFGAARGDLADGAGGTLGPVRIGPRNRVIPLSVSGPGVHGQGRLLQVRGLDLGPCPAAR